MKNESLKFYKILASIFLLIICLLSFLICKANERIQLNKGKNKPVIEKTSVSINTFGYSEALALLKRESNISIINFNNDPESKKLLNIEISYKGTLEALIETLKNLKKEENFNNIANIKIENINQENQTMNFNLYLVKNK